MNKTDQQEFNALLDAVATMLGRPSPSPMQLAMYFRVLEKYPLKTVRAAIDAHVSDPDQGRFFPTPAHIIGQIDAHTEQHPSDDEAWAIALDAADENKTVVWTQQIAEAWGACRSVLDIGDEVGARMAFKDVYGRLVREAKRAGEQIVWNVSEGFDKAHKETALAIAQDRGKVGGEELQQIGYTAPATTYAPEWVREFAKRLKAGLGGEKEASAEQKERERTVELKRDAEKKVENFKKSLA
jgi:hypothetical protein